MEKINAVNLIKDITEMLEGRIITMMKKMNLQCVSFALNGDSAEFDIERIYAFTSEDLSDGLLSDEVIAVALKDDKLWILVEDIRDVNDPLMNGICFGTDNDFNFTDFIPANPCMVCNHNELIADLHDSVQWVIENILKNKPLADKDVKYID